MSHSETARVHKALWPKNVHGGGRGKDGGALRAQMGDEENQRETEEGGVLVCNGMSTPGLSESPQKGVEAEDPGGCAREDPDRESMRRQMVLSWVGW